jgi:predicted small lipoprotein YifL
MRGIAVAWLVLVALALAGCGAQPGSSPDAAENTPPDATRPAISAPDLATVPPSGEPVTGEVPDQIMDDILADASQRSGEEPEAIDVVQAMAITWNDGSLGCPEPGMAYTQALVDGYHVILDAGDEELDYRVTSDGGFRLCENGGRPSG